MILSVVKFLIFNPIGWFCVAVLVAIFIYLRFGWQLFCRRRSNRNLVAEIIIYILTGILLLAAFLPRAFLIYRSVQEQLLIKQAVNDMARANAENNLKRMFPIKMHDLAILQAASHGARTFPDVASQIQQKITDGINQLCSPDFIRQIETDPTLFPTLLTAVSKSTGTPELKTHHKGATLTFALKNGGVLAIEFTSHLRDCDKCVAGKVDYLLVDSYSLFSAHLNYDMAEFSNPIFRVSSPCGSFRNL